METLKDNLVLDKKRTQRLFGKGSKVMQKQ